MVTPLTVTPAWLRLWLGSAGHDAGAASLALGITGKEFARCRISTGVLTVPVEGGAGILKRRNSDPVLSEHGKWRREHLGAWQTAYGRTPYFGHLMPEIAAVYEISAGMRLEEFNSRMLGVALGWIGTLPAEADRRRLAAVCDAAVKRVMPGLSIFDALFRLGKEAVFAL